MILYTSGTTGRPKGVLHSHNSIHALICQLGEHWLVEPGDKFLVPSPIAHIGGSIYAFECPLLLGTTAVLMDRWDPDEAVALMTGERCTHMAGATPFLDAAAGGRRARRHPAARPEGVHLRRRFGVAVADPQGRRLFRQRGGHPGVRLDGGAGHHRRRDPAGDTDHAADTDGGAGIADVTRSVGRRDPRPRAADAASATCIPRTNADAFDDDGYFRTGDLGALGRRRLPRRHRPGQGHHHPQRREHRAQGDRGHPRSAIPASPRSPIVGAARPADRRAGLRGHRARPASPARTSTSLREFLRGHGVAKFKVPEQVVIWDALPKNDAGKVLKHQIQGGADGGGRVTCR